MKATIVGIYDKYTRTYKSSVPKELIVGGNGATYKLIEFTEDLQ